MPALLARNALSEAVRPTVGGCLAVGTAGSTFNVGHGALQ